MFAFGIYLRPNLPTPLTIDWHRENGFEWLNKYLTSGHVKVNLISSKWRVQLVFPRHVSKLIKIGRVVFLGHRLFLRHATAKNIEPQWKLIKKAFFIFFLHSSPSGFMTPFFSTHDMGFVSEHLYRKSFFCSLFQPSKAACCKVAVGEHLQHCPAEPSRNWCFGDVFEVVSGSVRCTHEIIVIHSKQQLCELRLGCSIDNFFGHHFGSAPDQQMCAEKLIVLKKSLPTLKPVSDASSLVHQFQYRWFHILFFLDFPDDDTVVGRKADKKLSATNVPQTQRVELIIESIIRTGRVST